MRQGLVRLLRLDKVRLSLLDLLFSEGYVHQLEFDQLTFHQLEFDQLNIWSTQHSNSWKFDPLGVDHTIIFLSLKKMWKKNWSFQFALNLKLFEATFACFRMTVFSRKRTCPEEIKNWLRRSLGRVETNWCWNEDGIDGRASESWKGLKRKRPKSGMA